jgi:hypothetical protein
MFWWPARPAVCPADPKLVAAFTAAFKLDDSRTSRLESDRKWFDMQHRGLLKMAPLAAHPPLIMGARSTPRECAAVRE